uniref:Protein kinase domain-containing protein n=1 Tax=Angiostrongylus cantonensis TaxID=6313 RepID=A0A0K0D8I7_ANGCA
LLYVMPEHSTAVDMWAVGCIFAEMILQRELFPGRSVSGQIKIILTMLGAPSQKILDEIRCERTRRLIENFGDHAQRSWPEIMNCRERKVIHLGVLVQWFSKGRDRSKRNRIENSEVIPVEKKTCPVS